MLNNDGTVWGDEVNLLEASGFSMLLDSFDTLFFSLLHRYEQVLFFNIKTGFEQTINEPSLHCHSNFPAGLFHSLLA